MHMTDLPAPEAIARPKKRRPRVKLPGWAQFLLQAQKTVARPPVLFGTLGLCVVANMVLGLPASQLIWVAAPVWLTVWGLVTALDIQKRQRAGTWEKDLSNLVKTTSLGQEVAKRVGRSEKKPSEG